ncbi:MAG TPA: AAA family ATPase [Planctomycetes bacterium]|nr:AAA family ATPase [Planctomycetota bacterium]
MRYIGAMVKDLADEKFVLICGPRQVGKTTLARAWLKAEGGLYLNWDVPEDRRDILTRAYLDRPGGRALVLDEIHKYQRWKSYLKGLFDREGERRKVVVTGSARLDIFQRRGESLFGRHELLRLHPFSVGELTHGELRPPPGDWLRPGDARPQPGTWARLERSSGFPEPYTRDDILQKRRWSNRRRTLLVEEDVGDLSQIRALTLLEHLALLLPSRVGSPLSVNGLREELGVAHATAGVWLDVLERLYYCFRIPPYHRRVARSLRKERKLYLWDWTDIEDPGARFENMVAAHLLKAVHAWSDVGYGAFDLRYWRDKDGNEVDFVVTERGRPLVIFECRAADAAFSKPLCGLAARLGGIPHVQLVASFDGDVTRRGGRIVQADRYLANLV